MKNHQITQSFISLRSIIYRENLQLVFKVFSSGSENRFYGFKTLEILVDDRRQHERTQKIYLTLDYQQTFQLYQQLKKQMKSSYLTLLKELSIDLSVDDLEQIEKDLRESLETICNLFYITYRKNETVVV